MEGRARGKVTMTRMTTVGMEARDAAGEREEGRDRREGLEVAATHGPGGEEGTATAAEAEEADLLHDVAEGGRDRALATSKTGGPWWSG